MPMPWVGRDALGRFPSPDPTGWRTGVNLYGHDLTGPAGQSPTGPKLQLATSIIAAERANQCRSVDKQDGSAPAHTGFLGVRASKEPARMGATVDVLARKLDALEFEEGETRRTLVDAVVDTLRVGAGQSIVAERDCPAHACVLLEGLAARQKLLADGGRQILSFRIPGDFCGAETLASGALDHGVSAITVCVLAVIPREALLACLQADRSFALALWRETVADAAVEREWIVNVGRRSAVAAAAHLFCEMQARLQGVGLGSPERFEFRVTQSDLGDALGLSTVHVNRSLQELRRHGLLSFERGVVEIRDAAAMRELAGFDDRYLRSPHAVPPYPASERRQL